MSGLRNAGSKWAHDEEAEADLEADYKSGALKYFIPPSAIRPQIPPGGPRGASAGEHRGKAWVYVLRGHGNHDVTSMADVICDGFCFPWWNEDVTGEDVLYNGEEAGAWKGFWDPYKDTPEYQVRPRVPCLFLLFTTSDAIQRISEDDDLLDIDGRVATVPEWDVLFPWPFFLTTKIEMKGDLAHLMEGYSQFIHCAYVELHDKWKLEPKNPPHKMYTLAIPCMSCVTMPGDAADTVQMAMKYRDLMASVHTVAEEVGVKVVFVCFGTGKFLLVPSVLETWGIIQTEADNEGTELAEQDAMGIGEGGDGSGEAGNTES